MSRRFVVGLTGGIASGKSLALEAFGRAGAATVDLDAIVRELSKPGGQAYGRIVGAFGGGVVSPGGGLDRGRLAEVVFADPRRRRRLEGILHPLIRREMGRRIAKASGVVVVDVPLLFEKGRKSLARGFDATVLISTTKELQLRRACGRGMTKPQARARMAAQLPDAAKRKLADIVIDNAGSRGDLRRRIAGYYKAFDLICHGNHR
ncbi:MAG: dephospho-CoA kinase [Elusimicrobia bacterium]|nr:dephospho-CoA kinase [Elusimicrobiota bacterium]